MPDAHTQVPAELRIGLALGGGGAKGLAHIVALEAFDQAGIRPAAITGTSIGAIIGAAYAAGYSARAIREHALKMLRDRTDVMAKVFRARTGSFSDLFSGAFGSIVQVDGEIILKEFWPPSMPERFSDLRMPFVAVSTDFYGREQAAVTDGLIRPAVAASLAIPGLVRPVSLNNRLHIDGAAANPLPFDCMPVPCDMIIAIDVVGGPEAEDAATQPSVLEATLGASQIMQMAITEAKLANAQRFQSTPKVHLLQPRVAGFSALDFFAIKQILVAAEPMRAQIKALIAP